MRWTHTSLVLQAVQVLASLVDWEWNGLEKESMSVVGRVSLAGTRAVTDPC